MTGECGFCGRTHALAGWLGRTVIFQAAQCVYIAMHTEDPEVGYVPNFYPNWENVAEIFSAYYHKDGSCTGGNLHVVVDDTNVEDENIHWTDGLCSAREDQDGSALMSLLAELPMADRIRISCEVGGTDGKPLREDWKPEGLSV